MENKKFNIFLSFMSLVVLMMVGVTTTFAWFSGKGYTGKTMSYSRSLYIGAVDSDVTNFHGVDDGEGGFIYNEIDPLVGFQENNLIPGTYVYIRTDICNTSLTDHVIVNVFLQGIIYDAPLHEFLYFGTTFPESTRHIYKNDANYDSGNDEYAIASVTLIQNYTIQEDDTLSIYWYTYIDSDAEDEIANADISLGEIVIVYN